MRTSSVFVGACLLGAHIAASQDYGEPYRPQFHFTTPKNWINDPNGLLLHNGQYHLFNQYNPNGSEAGDTSWSHAISTDLTHWDDQPLAIPYDADASGALAAMYYTGSAVSDDANTSGFGMNGTTPLVAVFTIAYTQNVSASGGREVLAGTQAQGIAYSIDNGTTWTKYADNPVIALPPSQYQNQSQNFRDPYVSWYPPSPDGKTGGDGGHWAMVVSLSSLQKLLIYTSSDLKNWTQTSEFGPYNTQGGAWECPNLFPLTYANGSAGMKWVIHAGASPGPANGTGTQFFVGDFNGTTFTPDPSTIIDISQASPPDGEVFADFEQTTFTAAGWNATGDFVGFGPVTGAIGSQQNVSGFKGLRLVDTYFNEDLSKGTLTSQPFNITKPYIAFLIGGGYNPYNPDTYGTSADNSTALLLWVDGTVVASATGRNDEYLQWDSFHVANWTGQTAYLEIVDMGNVSWGHINVDQITFASGPVMTSPANWVDWGPDFYAAATYNGIGDYRRLGMAWMTNGEYAGDIPTSPFRGSMTIPRTYALATVGGRDVIVQTPDMGLFSLEASRPFAASYDSLSANTMLNITWQAMDLNLTFSSANLTALAIDSRFGISLRGTPDGSVETVVGYDFGEKQMYVDRTHYGGTFVADVFPDTFYAPLEPSADGMVTLRILLDWSGVEVFGGKGESVITAQIFPDANALTTKLFVDGDQVSDVKVSAREVSSAWST
ncbi:glycoside hydrolase family 32 protein [Coniophora puteana RWD-64-598 SS2]|uniref:Glycoside hydrolase family 32 protein n=1 Tax=Coniophora puteana (strain RWD-64-598) TaxID=741705 RepID=A0A5M3MWX3_CONPW|nr:glycoside hydrolase family 32 protein [Coniophora puteana RWD-64-598 SS2]EIW83570.1 glycoside hydrolase family 32 protein [Coniophora puteana RWD-64-598 SS2]